MRRSSCSAGWTLRRFLGAMGSAQPAPGGGSAAALASALGVALASKVCRLVARRRGPAAAGRGLRPVQAELDRLSRTLEGLIREDARVYEALVRAHRSGRGVEKARVQAIRCPLAICESSVLALRCVRKLEPLAGKYLGSDLKAARHLLKAGFEGASLMVKINQSAST